MLAVVEDGQILQNEIFPDDQLEDGLPRFEELTPLTSPSPGRR